jgi:hypothetical protein
MGMLLIGGPGPGCVIAMSTSWRSLNVKMFPALFHQPALAIPHPIRINK